MLPSSFCLRVYLYTFCACFLILHNFKGVESFLGLYFQLFILGSCRGWARPYSRPSGIFCRTQSFPGEPELPLPLSSWWGELWGPLPCVLSASPWRALCPISITFGAFSHILRLGFWWTLVLIKIDLTLFLFFFYPSYCLWLIPRKEKWFSCPIIKSTGYFVAQSVPHNSVEWPVLHNGTALCHEALNAGSDTISYGSLCVCVFFFGNSRVSWISPIFRWENGGARGDVSMHYLILGSFPALQHVLKGWISIPCDEWGGGKARQQDNTDVGFTPV